MNQPPNPIEADQDLVDRIFDYLLAELPGMQQAASEGRLLEMKLAVRQEFRGEGVRVGLSTTAGRRDVGEQVLSMFNGRNATEIARRLGISRATVYRRLKQAGVFEPQEKRDGQGL